MTRAYEEALKIIKEAKRTGETILSLGGNADSKSNLSEGLQLTDDDLMRLWPKLSQISDLTDLRLNENQLTTLPEDFGRFTNLTRLRLDNNQLTTLPEDFGRLANLATLYLDRNQLTTLPNQFGRLTNLNKLDLTRNQLTTLFSSISIQQFLKLKELYLHKNPALDIPSEILGPTNVDVIIRDKQPANPEDILRYYFGQPVAVKRPEDPTTANLLNGIEKPHTRLKQLERKMIANGHLPTPLSHTATSKQPIKQLDEALCKAYDKSSLMRMLYYELEKRLDHIASDGNFEDIVFSVIMAAEKEGWLDELVRAAEKDRPTNKKVQAVARQWGVS